MSRISLLSALLVIGSVVVGANAKSPSRIYGGQLANHNEFNAAVTLESPGSLIHACGGSIIGPRHILTAAHCVDDKGPNGIIVRAGIHDIRDKHNAIERSVAKIFVHPDYISYIEGYRHVANDIAILMLLEDLPIGGYVLPLLLPTHQPRRDVEYTLAGWGQNDPKPIDYQFQLKTLSFKLGDANTCRNFVPKTICAYSTRGSACSGDSGSPLVRGSHLYGIVSTVQCTVGGLDGFVNVYDYLGWIKTIIRENPY